MVTLNLWPSQGTEIMRNQGRNFAGGGNVTNENTKIYLLICQSYNQNRVESKGRTCRFRSTVTNGLSWLLRERQKTPHSPETKLDALLAFSQSTLFISLTHAFLTLIASTREQDNGDHVRLSLWAAWGLPQNRHSIHICLRNYRNDQKYVEQKQSLWSSQVVLGCAEVRNAAGQMPLALAQPNLQYQWALRSRLPFL